MIMIGYIHLFHLVAPARMNHYVGSCSAGEIGTTVLVIDERFSLSLLLSARCRFLGV